VISATGEGTAISVEFTEAVDASSVVAADFTVVLSAGGAGPGVITAAVDGATVTLTLDDPLTPEVSYTVTVTDVDSLTGSTVSVDADSATFTATGSAAVDLAVWDFDGDTPVVTTTAMDITGSDVTVAMGSATFPGGLTGDSISANGWTAMGQYFEFSITVGGGRSITITSLNFADRASGTGPATFAAEYDTGGGFVALTGVNGSTNSTIAARTFPIVVAEQGPFTGTVTFRLTGDGASGSSGTWRIDDLTIRGVVQ
jgi:hypothetical protein